jgi:hypothetical protein
MTTDLTIIEAGVFTITPTTPVADIANVLGQLEWMQRRIKEVRDELESRLIERIELTGEFLVGETRYYVGNPKKTKCRDNLATLNALLTVCEGDVDRLAECLASGAWKHGTVRVLLEDSGKGELFDTLFETTSEPELKEGVAVKRLQKANLAFTK